MKLSVRYRPKVGDIQTDRNNSEWVIIGITHSGLSRVRRNSLAHQVHALDMPEIAESITPPWVERP